MCGEALTLHSQLAWVLGRPIQRKEGLRFWHLEGFFCLHICLYAAPPMRDHVTSTSRLRARSLSGEVSLWVAFSPLPPVLWDARSATDAPVAAYLCVDDEMWLDTEENSSMGI